MLTSQLLPGAARTSLPHPDLPHRHAPLIALPPGWQPLIRRIPESPLGIGRRVEPRLAADLVEEPARARPNGHVEDEVELLVKGRVARRRLRVGPRVRQQRLVLRHLVEPAQVVERLVLVEPDVQDLVDPAVQVEVDVLGRPLDAEGVEAVGVAAPAELLGARRAPEGVAAGRGGYDQASVS